MLAGESGTHVYTSKWKEFDIVYHVAPLIPARKSDRQQIHRKRHVGNGMFCGAYSIFTPKNQMTKLMLLLRHRYCIANLLRRRCQILSSGDKVSVSSRFHFGA
jgi:Rap/ran-GAP